MTDTHRRAALTLAAHARDADELREWLDMLGLPPYERAATHLPAQPPPRQEGQAMSTDPLADALAAEEHRQGRPYLADPDHCERCAEVDQAWFEATCEHDRAVEITALEDARQHWHCVDCGHQWRGEIRPTVPPPPPVRVDESLIEWFPV